MVLALLFAFGFLNDKDEGAGQLFTFHALFHSPTCDQSTQRMNAVTVCFINETIEKKQPSE